METIKRGANFLQEFSIPLIAGVFFALISANVASEWYHYVVHALPFGELSIWGHDVTVHFLVNDVFMVFFFGIAAKEITEAALPGGDLNPISKALNPLIATLGGVLGPVLVFFGGLALCYQLGYYTPDVRALSPERGWGIPTATDIALAWLVARTVFGRKHPAVNFLLLLAIADDAIGLVIIAVFYGNPDLPPHPEYLALVVAGMGVAYGLRRLHVETWPAYVFLAGPLAWCGLMMAHLHAALALVFIVPFLPGPSTDRGLFADHEEEDLPPEAHHAHSTLHQFEHHLKLFVDFGLFFFAFANAGVALAGIGPMTWLVLGALVVGKTVGVTALGVLAEKLGFPLPENMSRRDLVMAGFVAALGLTVALFVADAAFSNPDLQGQAKMGALFSAGVGLVAIAIGRVLGMHRGIAAEASRQDDGSSRQAAAQRA